MTGRQVHRSGGVDPEVYGLADAVRVGDLVFVSGQTAYDAAAGAGGLGDVGAQLRAAYAKVATALEAVGATMADVVDETLYVTDTAAAVAAARTVRADVYGGRFDLASTICEVAAFGHPALQVEVRCTAVVSGRPA